MLEPSPERRNTMNEILNRLDILVQRNEDATGLYSVVGKLELLFADHLLPSFIGRDNPPNLSAIGSDAETSCSKPADSGADSDGSDAEISAAGALPPRPRFSAASGAFPADAPARTATRFSPPLEA